VLRWVLLRGRALIISLMGELLTGTVWRRDLRPSWGSEHVVLTWKLLSKLLGSKNLIVPQDRLVRVEWGSAVKLYPILLSGNDYQTRRWRCLSDDRVTVGYGTRENMSEMRNTGVLRWESM